MKIEIACLALSTIRSYGPKSINDLLERIDVLPIETPADFIQLIRASGLKIRTPFIEELESSLEPISDEFLSILTVRTL